MLSADCFRKSIAKGGLRGMYQGSGVNILLITPEKAIKLVANDYFRHLLRKPNGYVLCFLFAFLIYLSLYCIFDCASEPTERDARQLNF